jgi:predicted metal-dependent peptidase
MVNRSEQLAKASKDLMLKEPFYGMFLIMLNKTWENKRIPTAAVSRNGINYNLMLNENFWDILQEGQKRGLLKHELLHIGFFHLTDFGHMTDHLIANIAQDIEINQYIDKGDLPPGPQLPETYPELKLEPKKGSNYYYEKLMQGKKQGNCPNLNAMIAAHGAGLQVCIVKGKGGDEEVQVPDHSTWEDFKDLDESTQKLIRSQTEHILKEVADQVQKSRGTIPGEFQAILDRINTVEPPKFDWKSFLRRFVGGSQKIYTKKVRRKFNKRYEENPGLKIKPRRHILVGVDTSGSVSNDELKEFFHEIHHIHKTGSDVTVIQCDAAISDVSPYKPNAEIKLHGRGGTDFQPVIDYYNEHKNRFTCLVYLTDGECSPPQNVRGRMLWVLSSRSKENDQLPGITIKLN